MARRVSHIALRGGLDLVSSPLFVKPGRLWSAINYVPVEAGYRRIAGYERFDGRASPSDAEYWLLGFTLDAGAGETAAEAGDALTGATSGATAVVLKVLNDAYVIGELAGTFADGETLRVSGTAKGSANDTPRKLAAASIDDDFDFRDLAAAHRRSLIAGVPGSGPVRGIWYFKGSVYAVRDEAGANPARAKLYRATATGWTEVFLGYVQLRFKEGIEEPADGAMLVTNFGFAARYRGSELTSGSWGGRDAVGVLYVELDDGSSTDMSNNWPIRIGATYSAGRTFAKVDGAQTLSSPTLPAGGRYEFLNANFEGQADSLKAFGANGAGPAFHLAYDERSGEHTFTSITTGHADDRPVHLAEHSNHLLLGYRGGSLIVSETGNPDGYVAARGAAELACGQDILGLLGGVGLGNTVIMGADRIQVLYGNDSENFQLVDQSQAQTGGVEGTLQSVGGPIYLDNRGVRSLTTTDAYGNWVIGTMTVEIQPWIDRQRNQRNRAVGSMRVRSSDQYRLWFASGVGVCIYIGRGRPEISFLDYGSDADDVKIFPRCSVSAEDEDRIERVWFGADNGVVYEAERGRSFDGEPIRAFARLPLNYVGMPSVNKRWFGAELHLDLESRANLGMSALFDDGFAPDQSLDEASIHGGGGLYEEGFFDEFYYDAPLNGYARYPMDGFGRNASLLVLSDTAKERAHTLNGLSLHWARRGALRI